MSEICTSLLLRLTNLELAGLDTFLVDDCTGRVLVITIYMEIQIVKLASRTIDWWTCIL